MTVESRFLLEELESSTEARVFALIEPATTIIAVGIDMVGLEFFRKRTPKTHSGFYNRIFTDEERTRCARHSNAAFAFASCFAVKEAAVKALTGAREVGCPLPPSSVLMICTDLADAVKHQAQIEALTGVAALLTGRGSSTIAVGGWDATAGIALHAAASVRVPLEVVTATVIATTYRIDKETR